MDELRCAACGGKDLTHVVDEDEVGAAHRHELVGHLDARAECWRMLQTCMHPDQAREPVGDALWCVDCGGLLNGTDRLWVLPRLLAVLRSAHIMTFRHALPAEAFEPLTTGPEVELTIEEARAVFALVMKMGAGSGASVPTMSAFVEASALALVIGVGNALQKLGWRLARPSEPAAPETRQ